MTAARIEPSENAEAAAQRSRRTLWIVCAVLALLFALFIAPLILAFGKLLITRRTM